MQEEKIRNRQGFTLLEILLVIGIMGVIAVFTIGISHSIRNMTKVNDTRGRMEQIAAKAREFYRAHEYLPVPGVSSAGYFNLGPGVPQPDGGQVPVEASALNMEQKYRLDAWGRYFHYFVIYQRPPDVDGIGFTVQYQPTDTSLLNDINGVTVYSKPVAAVLVSGGPSQFFDSFGTLSFPATYPEGGFKVQDDIIIPIDVSQEAVEMAIEELKVLKAKVKAFDAIYEGISNDTDANIDEDDNGATAPNQCFRQTNLVCPPNPGPTAGGTDPDPNCGTATLDHIQDGYYTGCASLSARDFICDFYSLPDRQRIDPWLNAYLWGADSTPENPYDGTPPNNLYPSSDPRYHKFFSAGPDGTAGNADDIMP